MKVYSIKFIKDGAWAAPQVVAMDLLVGFLEAQIAQAVTEFSVQYLGEMFTPKPGGL